jgi:ABC-type oligopeptide transport system ATPase subunit
MSKSEYLIEIHNLKKIYAGRGVKRAAVHAVDDVSLQIRRGETFGIIGESGSGKSTLGRLILRLIEPTAGEIIFKGMAITDMKENEMRAFRQHMQIVFQNSGSEYNPRKSVGEQIAFPMRQFGLYPAKEIPERVVHLMERVGMKADQVNRYPHEFSGGQRQRIGIARALATNPEFVVLDEPTSALDVSIQAQIINLLLDIQKELGITLLMITHNLGIAKYFCDSVGVMSQGKLVETGSSNEVFDYPKHAITRELIESILEPEVYDSDLMVSSL